MNDCLTVAEVAKLFDLNEWTLRMWLNRLEILKYTVCPERGIMLPPETVHLIAEVVALTKRGGMTIDAVREHLALMVEG